MGLPCGTFVQEYKQDIAVVRTRAQYGLLITGLILLFTFPLYGSSYLLHIANLIAVTIIAALGLNILTGYAGQISIGHTAFIAVGGYTSILLVNLGLAYPLVLLCSGLVAGIVGVAFGLPSLRVKGFYLLLATLAAQVIIMFILSHWDVTGGAQGLYGPPVTIWGIEFHDEWSWYFLIMVMLVLMTFFAKNMTRTKLGRAFVAVRDNDLAAEVMGVNIFRYKLLAFFLGCFYAGVAGSLWAHWLRGVTPEQFTMMGSVWYLGYLIVGGMGTTVGPFFGVILITLLSEALSTFMFALSPVYPNLVGLIAPLTGVLFGIIIALFLIFEPRGLAHRWGILKAYYRLWPFAY